MLWFIGLLSIFTLLVALQQIKQIDIMNDPKNPMQIEYEDLIAMAKTVALIAFWVSLLLVGYLVWPYIIHCSISSIIYGCN